MRRRRERLDKLDAALDGRLVEVDEELAPLVETAAKLRAALTGIELDPEAAGRHLGMVLDGEAEVVALPARPRRQIGRWRRGVAAVALAAALTALPATMASASALPGQALYPVKLAVEQFQVAAVSWSSSREADERIRIADHRLDELHRLVQLRAADRIPAAVERLDRAYVDARQAVAEAVSETGDVREARALHGKLAALTAAIERPPVPPDPANGTLPITPATYGPVVATSTGSPTTTLASTTTLAATTTLAPTTTMAPTTTLAPTTLAPTTTVPTDASDSPDQGGDDDSGQGSSGETATTLP